MSARCDQYMDKAVKHLASLPSKAERRAILVRKIEEWEQLYALWANKVDRGGDPGKATASDYVETIAALHCELVRYSERVAA